MDESAIEIYREALLVRKRELRAIEETLRDSGATVELDQSRVGRLSRMDAMQGQQMALETARRHQVQLKRIEGALRRIANGDFGYCFVCDEEIDSRRLDADPAITRCIACADQ